MIARTWEGVGRFFRSTAAWLDYGVAVLMACIESCRAPVAVSSREPALVAQAITVTGGRAVVTPVQLYAPQHHHRVISPLATAAIAAAALAATLGARGMFLSGYGSTVTALAGEPGSFALRAPAQDRLPGNTAVIPSASEEVAGTGAHSMALPPVDPAEVRGIRAVPDLRDADAVSQPVAEPEVEPAVVAESLVADISGGEERVTVAASPAISATPEATEAPAPVAVSEAVASPAAPDGLPEALPAYAGIRYTADQVRSLALGAGWPAERVDQLINVAYCESRLRPDALGQGTLGLMQLMPFWFRVAGADLELWSDPLVNLRVAFVAFQADLEQGRDPWYAWSCKPAQ